MVRPIDADKVLKIFKKWIDTKQVEGEELRAVETCIAVIEDMPTLTPLDEPLTLEGAKKERYIWFTPLNDWAKVTPFGVLFFGTEELTTWETLCEEWGYRFKAYRRPPEGASNGK